MHTWLGEFCDAIYCLQNTCKWTNSLPIKMAEIVKSQKVTAGRGDNNTNMPYISEKSQEEIYICIRRLTQTQEKRNLHLQHKDDSCFQGWSQIACEYTKVHHVLHPTHLQCIHHTTTLPSTFIHCIWHGSRILSMGQKIGLNFSFSWKPCHWPLGGGGVSMEVLPTSPPP